MVFARSAREALAAGVAAHATPALVSCLREAGELLRAVADADDRMLISRRILDVAYRLDGLRLAEQSPPPSTAHPPAPAATPAPSPQAARAGTELPIVPIESLGYDERPSAATGERPIVPVESPVPHDLPIVPIESLAYDERPSVAEAESPIVPIESLVPAGGLEASYRTYDRLRRERGDVPASLAVLAGRAPAPAAKGAEPVVATVEIGVLCYHGRAALERAFAVRQQLADELARNGGLEAIQPLLQELLDLVPLALAES